ncbi:hypothetical protein ES705_49652 [subsurface metagenome]
MTSRSPNKQGRNTVCIRNIQMHCKDERWQTCRNRMAQFQEKVLPQRASDTLIETEEHFEERRDTREERHDTLKGKGVHCRPDLVVPRR